MQILNKLAYPMAVLLGHHSPVLCKDASVAQSSLQRRRYHRPPTAVLIVQCRTLTTAQCGPELSPEEKEPLSSQGSPFSTARWLIFLSCARLCEGLRKYAYLQTPPSIHNQYSSIEESTHHHFPGPCLFAKQVKATSHPNDIG